MNNKYIKKIGLYLNNNHNKSEKHIYNEVIDVFKEQPIEFTFFGVNNYNIWRKDFVYLTQKIFEVNKNNKVLLNLADLKLNINLFEFLNDKQIKVIFDLDESKFDEKIKIIQELLDNDVQTNVIYKITTGENLYSNFQSLRKLGISELNYTFFDVFNFIKDENSFDVLKNQFSLIKDDILKSYLDGYSTLIPENFKKCFEYHLLKEMDSNILSPENLENCLPGLGNTSEIYFNPDGFIFSSNLGEMNDEDIFLIGRIEENKIQSLKSILVLNKLTKAMPNERVKISVKEKLKETYWIEPKYNIYFSNNAFEVNHNVSDLYDFLQNESISIINVLNNKKNYIFKRDISQIHEKYMKNIYSIFN